MTGAAIRCHCSRCHSCTYLRLSDWLAAHPEVTDPHWGDIDVDVELDEAIDRHPAGGPT